MQRFMLEGSRQCAIFYFAHLLCMSYVTKTFLLNSSSVSNKQCFVHGQDQKGKLKHITKNFVEFRSRNFERRTTKWTID